MSTTNRSRPAQLAVATVQHTCGPDLAANQARTVAGIRAAAAHGARLVVLQELHRAVYFCQTENTDLFDLSEPIPGPSTALYGALAAELGIVLVTSLFERRAAGVHHNTAVVFEADGSIAGRYRKMHIPDDPGFYEKFYFVPGDLGFEPIDTSVGRLGVLVCWDQWFPEAARLMAMAGAEVLIYPTAIGWDPRDEAAEQTRQRDAWITIQRAHAVANGVPVVVCNRMGHEPDPSGQSEGIRFWGHSFVAGPQGEFLAVADDADLDSEGPTTLHATLDLARGEHVRRIWPYFRDRRVDRYGDLLKIWRD